MKRKNVRILSFVMCILLCLCFSVPALATDGSLPKNSNNSEEYILNLQSFYISARFKEKYTTLIVSRSTQTVQMDYPQNYGGIYIDSENKLHIGYVGNVDTLKDPVRNHEVEFDSVKFSYNYLNKLYEVLSEKITDLNITAVSIDEIRNKIEIAVDESFRKKTIDCLFETVPGFESDSVVFIDPVSFTATDPGGTSIKCNGIITLGYNAKKLSNGKYGFVTCGHGVSSIGDIVKRNNSTGTTLGTVTNRQLGGKIDACFVTYSNQSNATPLCLAGGDLTGTYSPSQITTGMIVHKYGSTTLLQQGTVTSANSTISFSGFTFIDQVKLAIRQEPGDSGAPVVHNFIGPMPGGQTPPTTLIGIATIADSTTWNVALASKAANINSAFGLSTYILII